MPEAAADRLPGLLNDADADVRLLACEIARALPAEDASQILEELIERELNTNVCAAAIEVLAETGNVRELAGFDQVRLPLSGRTVSRRLPSRLPAIASGRANRWMTRRR